ncbi:MAG TPA: DUF5679 domain-containing protein [Chloroflexota bacterium]|nr:DUF5679 domain-containing protein [Chloroflexota bacterium]
MTTAEQEPKADLRGIDVDAIAREGLLVAGKSGTLTWPLSGSTDHIQTLALKGSLRLTYVETLSNSETTHRYSYDVPLQRTRRHRGPDKVAFLCPLCKAKVQRLYYVRPGGGFFLCEECQGMVDEESRLPRRPKSKRSYVRKKPMLLTGERTQTTAFCCRCRDRRELADITTITMSNGRPAIRGVCSVCGTPSARILGVGQAPL